MIQRILQKIEGIKTVGAIGWWRFPHDESDVLRKWKASPVYILLDEELQSQSIGCGRKNCQQNDLLDCKVETNSSSMDYSGNPGKQCCVRIKGNDIDTLRTSSGGCDEQQREPWMWTIVVKYGTTAYHFSMRIRKKLRNTDTQLHRYISLSVRRWQTARAQPRDFHRHQRL